jgi:hypothetical protein
MRSKDDLAQSLRLIADHVAQCLSQRAHPALHALQLGDKSHGVLAGEGLRPRLQHGNAAAHPLQLMKAIHGTEHLFAGGQIARGF